MIILNKILLNKFVGRYPCKISTEISISQRPKTRRNSLRDLKILEAKKARRERCFGNIAKISKCQQADPADPDIINSLREIFSCRQNKHTEIRLEYVKNNQICTVREVTHNSTHTVSDTFTFTSHLATFNDREIAITETGNESGKLTFNLGSSSSFPQVN